MKMPRHLKEIDELYGLPALNAAVEFFGRHGVSLGYVPRKGWRFFCTGRADGPTCVICWVSVASLIEMLDEPSQTLKAIAAKGGNVK